MQVSCNKLLHILMLLAWFAAVAMSASAQTLVIVRHAEKFEPWSAEDRLQPLSAEGLARAERLRTLLRDLDIKAVYTSNTTRALTTAIPAATDKRLKPVPHPACEKSDSLSQFIGMVTSTYSESDFILVVSHSNIIPEWLTYFRTDAASLTEMGIAFDSRYKGYLVQGYDGVWIVNLPRDAESRPHVRYAVMGDR